MSRDFVADRPRRADAEPYTDPRDVLLTRAELRELGLPDSVQPVQLRAWWHRGQGEKAQAMHAAKARIRQERPDLDAWGLHLAAWGECVGAQANVTTEVETC